MLRPSDGKPVKKLAFIQCVGSRDSARGNGYCSSICCMSATKEAMVALEHVPGLDVSIFCMDVRAFGKEFDGYVNRARDEHGVQYIRAMPSRIVEMPGSKNAARALLRRPGRASTRRSSTWSCSRSACGRAPWVKDMAAKLGLDLNQFGFCQTDRLAPMAASRPGIYVAGAFQEPKDIPESVAQASARGRLRDGEAVAPVRGTADQAPRVPLGARRHRREAAHRRLHLPLRPQHRVGGRRRSGRRGGGASCPTSSTPRPTSTPARTPASSTSRT